MTDVAREPYRRWRVFVFVVVAILTPLTVAALVAVVASALPSLDTGALSGIAAGASTDSSDATPSAGTASSDPTSAQSSGQSSVDATTIGPTIDIARDSQATASTTAPDNVDGADSRTNYRPQNMLDGDMSTAWRATGDGAGVSVTITFHGMAALTEVGLVPGYAKTDPVTGVNRFYQDHRITAVNWIFGNGESVHQEFADSPTMQTIPVDTVTDSVTIDILGVLPADEGYDYTPISDVTLLGAYR